MKVHYARVSTIEQNIQRQLPDTDEKVYWDKCSGRVPFKERDSASKLLKDAEEGNISQINVSSIDRLGRDAVNVLQTIKRFTDMGVCIVSQKEGLRTLLEDGKENPVAKLLVSVLSTLAEIDYNNRREAQAEGIAVAKAKGKYKGRKKGSKATDEEYLQRYAGVVNQLEDGMSIRDTAKLAEVSPTTVQKVKNTLKRVKEES